MALTSAQESKLVNLKDLNYFNTKSNTEIDKKYVQPTNITTAQSNSNATITFAGTGTGADTKTITFAGNNIGIAVANNTITLSVDTMPEYSIAETTTTSGMLKTYGLKKGNSFIVGSTIDIPKDFLVKSATMEVVTAEDKAAGGKFADNTSYAIGDPYLDFVINTKSSTATNEHLYVNVKTLVDVYTAADTSISVNANKIAVNLATNSALQVSSGLKLQIDSTNANGLSITASGLKLDLATTSTAGAMSSTDKSKLDNIEAQANKTIVDSALSSTSTNPVQNKTINTALSNKVDKDGSKVLSDNNYTTTEKNKLSGIATGAEVNQNAFSSITNGTNTISAATKTDTLTIVGGGATSVTYDTTNKKLTISSTDNNTTYNEATTSTAGLMSADDKTKLNGIASGAEVNVQADWNETTTTSDAYIKNKPTSLPASDVYSWAKASTKPTYTKSEVGLGNVENKSSATIRGELTSSNVTTALGYTPLNSTLKGAASGLAELDSSGKVPSSQLPSYVDDTIEGYLYNSKFYVESTHTTEITGETGKIYVDLPSNKTYRWSGTTFVEISASVALGETSSTAYRGDRGKIAYDHSQAAHAPSNAQANQNAFSNVIIGSTTIAADTTTDSLTLVAGSNITLTPDATNDKITIAATDTTYSVATTSANGLMSSTDKTKLNSLASIYSTGNGLNLTSNALSVKATNGIEVTTNGVGVKKATGNNAVIVDSNGVSVKYDNDTIVYDSTNNWLKANVATEADIDALWA